MRIFIDRRVKQEDGRFADGGGFWVSANIWGWRTEWTNIPRTNRD